VFDSVAIRNRRRVDAQAAQKIKRPPLWRGARLFAFAGCLAVIALVAAPGHGPYPTGTATAADLLTDGGLSSHRSAEARRLGNDVERLTMTALRHSFGAARTVSPSPRFVRRVSFARTGSKQVGSRFEGFEARFASWWGNAGEEDKLQKAAFTDSRAGDEIQCLAQNIYFEARGETHVGKLAVGQVVMNRVASKKFPNSICDVVRQGGEQIRFRCQFSWWCDGKSDKPKDLAAWQESLSLAKDIYRGRTDDPTGGALWYHADYVAPYWRSAFVEGPTIGRHIFYRAQPKDGRTQLAKTARSD